MPCHVLYFQRLNPADQIQHIPHVRRAIKYISEDLQDNDDLPGFCLPKKVSEEIVHVFQLYSISLLLLIGVNL